MASRTLPILSLLCFIFSLFQATLAFNSSVSIFDARALGFKIGIQKYYQENIQGTIKDKNNRLLRYGSTATWANVDDINTNEKLAGLARQGCQEMWDINGTPKTNKDVPPPVMGALRIGTQVTFSSSVVGFSLFYGKEKNPDRTVLKDHGKCPAVREALKRCVGSQHGNEARCAEMHAMQAYCHFREDTDGTALDTLPDSSIVAVNCKAQDSTTWVVVNACSGRNNIPESFGCRQVIETTDVSIVGGGTGFEDISVAPIKTDGNCLWTGNFDDS